MLFTYSLYHRETRRCRPELEFLAELMYKKLQLDRLPILYGTAPGVPEDIAILPPSTLVAVDVATLNGHLTRV